MRISTRSATPASATSVRASSACDGDSVIPVTLTPYSRAAWIAKLPQPQPTSSTRCPGVQLELLRDQVELGALRLLERLRAAREQRTAVGHRLVEEQREELVADVVVVADRLRVALRAVALAGQQQLGRGPARNPGRERRERERGEQARPVARPDRAAAPSRRRPGTPRRCRRSRATPRRRRDRARAARVRAARARSPTRGARRTSASAARSPVPGRRPRTRSRTAAREARARARGTAARWDGTTASRAA